MLTLILAALVLLIVHYLLTLIPRLHPSVALALAFFCALLVLYHAEIGIYANVKA